MSTLFPMEGRSLPTMLPPHFEAFYRLNLRTVIGSRIRARDLMERYTVWATASVQPAMTFSDMRHAMEVVGHRRITSNGIHYGDIGLADAFPDVADTLPNPFRGRLLASTTHADADPASLLPLVDAALTSLLDLRRAVSKMAEPSEPHLAAIAALGLGNARG